MNYHNLFSRLIVIFLSFFAGFVYSEDKAIDLFGEDLLNIIRLNQIEKFSKIGCFPQNCVDKGIIEYVFGAGDDAGTIQKILNSPDIKIKIFGPFTYTDEKINQSYIIVFYKPAQVAFDEVDRLSIEDRKALWEKGYVETVVINVNGEWVFHGAPFYFYGQLPWTDDYG